jgi:hypothetical protein
LCYLPDDGGDDSYYDEQSDDWSYDLDNPVHTSSVVASHMVSFMPVSFLQATCTIQFKHHVIFLVFVMIVIIIIIIIIVMAILVFVMLHELLFHCLP